MMFRSQETTFSRIFWIVQSYKYSLMFTVKTDKPVLYYPFKQRMGEAINSRFAAQ